MKQTTLEEKSAGGVVFRRINEETSQMVEHSSKRTRYEFLIGEHSGYHKWVLPKGLIERGESAQETARREVMEEVGVEAIVINMVPLETVEYWYYADLDMSGKTTRRVRKYQEDPDFAKDTTGKGGKKTRVHKQVIFYLMEMERDLGRSGWEMTKRKWVSYEEGMKLLAFESERAVLEKAGIFLKCL